MRCRPAISDSLTDSRPSIHGPLSCIEELGVVASSTVYGLVTPILQDSKQRSAGIPLVEEAVREDDRLCDG